MSEFLTALSEPAFRPFLIAGSAVAAIAVLEVIALVFGVGLFDAIDDLLPDVDSGDSAGVLGWLGFGEVPFMVLLVVILALFSIIGFAVQSAALAIAGGPLAPALASLVSLVLTIPAAGRCSRWLARLIPSVESSGVDAVDLVGCSGVMVQGVATGDRIAEARVTDPKGHSHWLRVRAELGEELQPGEPIRVVGRSDSVVYIARRPAQLATQATETV